MRLHNENQNQMNFFLITLVGNSLKNSGYANLMAYNIPEYLKLNQTMIIKDNKFYVELDDKHIPLKHWIDK